MNSLDVRLKLHPDEDSASYTAVSLAFEHDPWWSTWHDLTSSGSRTCKVSPDAGTNPSSYGHWSLLSSASLWLPPRDTHQYPPHLPMATIQQYNNTTTPTSARVWPTVFKSGWSHPTSIKETVREILPTRLSIIVKQHKTKICSDRPWSKHQCIVHVLLLTHTNRIGHMKAGRVQSRTMVWQIYRQVPVNKIVVLSRNLPSDGLVSVYQAA